MHLLEGEMDIQTVQDVFGHKDLSTMQICPLAMARRGLWGAQPVECLSGRENFPTRATRRFAI